MTARRFRQIALGMDGAHEGAHMGHADFRVGGRIFATLGYPDAKWGMVALTPEQQQIVLREHGAMSPAKGAWGVQGATMVRLAPMDDETLGAAMTMAWQNALTESSSKKSARKRRTAR